MITILLYVIVKVSFLWRMKILKIAQNHPNFINLVYVKHIHIILHIQKDLVQLTIQDNWAKPVQFNFYQFRLISKRSQNLYARKSLLKYSLHISYFLKTFTHHCAVVMILLCCRTDRRLSRQTKGWSCRG